MREKVFPFHIPSMWQGALEDAGWPAYPGVSKLCSRVFYWLTSQAYFSHLIHITSDIHITKSGTSRWLLVSPKEKRWKNVSIPWPNQNYCIWKYPFQVRGNYIIVWMPSYILEITSPKWQTFRNLSIIQCRNFENVSELCKLYFSIYHHFFHTPSLFSK